jgi:hypothetical protein
MVTPKEMLYLSDAALDALIEVLDFGDLDKPFEPTDATFSVDEYEYRCEFVLGPSAKNSNDRVLEFKFVVADGPNKPARDHFQTDVQHAVVVKKWGIGIIGVKHPLTALKRALQSLLRYVRSYKPKYVSFSAEEPNRQRLYKKFYEYYGHLLPQYRMCNKNPETDEPLDQTEFWLERIE